MAGTVRLLDVDQAHVTIASDGLVTFDDPASPWLVSIRVTTTTGRSRIAQLVAQPRTPDAPAVTAARLARLPVTQMLHAAAAQLHPNEVYYRMVASPKRPGQRSWDEGHWQRVRQVCEWATATGRRGGPARAVADLWGVAQDPTAYRWIARARLHQNPQELG